MSLVLTGFAVAQTISKVIEVSGFIINSILFSYHSYHTIKLKHCISNLEWLSLSLMFLYATFGFSLTLMTFSLQPRFLSCKIQIDIITSNYLLTKTMLYLLFLERLFSVFQGTPYSFNSTNIYLSRITLTIYMLALIFLTFLTGKGYYDPIHDSCYEQYPIYMHGIAAIGDLVIGILTSVLFTRRLMLLRISTNNPFIKKTYSNTDYNVEHTNQNDHHGKKSVTTPSQKSIMQHTPSMNEPNKVRNEEENHEMSHPQNASSSSAIITTPSISSPRSPRSMSMTKSVQSMHAQFSKHRTMRSNSNRKIMNVMMQDTLIWRALNKFTLLTFISVFTTLLSLVLAGIFGLGGLWVSIDAIVNCWCVLLCFKQHERLYKWICCNNGENVICVECLSWYSCNCCCEIVPASASAGNDDAKQSGANKPNLKGLKLTTLSYNMSSSVLEERCKGNEGNHAQSNVDVDIHINIPIPDEHIKNNDAFVNMTNLTTRMDRLPTESRYEEDGNRNSKEFEDIELPEFKGNVPTNSCQIDEMDEMPQNMTKLQPQRSIAGIPIEVNCDNGGIQIVR